MLQGACPPEDNSGFLAGSPLVKQLALWDRVSIPKCFLLGGQPILYEMGMRQPIEVLRSEVKTKMVTENTD